MCVFQLVTKKLNLLLFYIKGFLSIIIFHNHIFSFSNQVSRKLLIFFFSRVFFGVGIIGYACYTILHHTWSPPTHVLAFVNSFPSVVSLLFPPLLSFHLRFRVTRYRQWLINTTATLICANNFILLAQLFVYFIWNSSKPHYAFIIA